MSSKAVIAGVALLIGGTAAAEPAEGPKAVPEPGAAYVAITFHPGRGGTVLVLRDERGHDHELGLSSLRSGGIASAYSASSVHSPSEEWLTDVFRLPPGEYVVDTVEFERGKRVPVALPRFIAQPGHVLFLGRFDTYGTLKGDWFWAHLDLLHTPADLPIGLVKKAYPLLGALPLECLQCTAASEGAKEFAAPAVVPKVEIEPVEAEPPAPPPSPEDAPAEESPGAE